LQRLAPTPQAEIPAVALATTPALAIQIPAPTLTVESQTPEVTTEAVATQTPLMERDRAADLHPAGLKTPAVDAETVTVVGQEAVATTVAELDLAADANPETKQVEAEVPEEGTTEAEAVTVVHADEATDGSSPLVPESASPSAKDHQRIVEK
jgi:hypothetical protein